MNVSRLQNLKFRRSWENGTLSLKILNLVLFFQKSTRKYTALTTYYNKPARVGKMSLSSCKKHCAVGNTPKVPFYLTTVTISSPSIKRELLNPEVDNNKEKKERSNAHTQQKQEHLFAFLSSAHIHCVYTLLLKKRFLCKLNLFKL